jgi:hypothetical protein
VDRSLISRRRVIKPSGSDAETKFSMRDRSDW